MTLFAYLDCHCLAARRKARAITCVLEERGFVPARKGRRA
jgi:hypothetical protein